MSTERVDVLGAMEDAAHALHTTRNAHERIALLAALPAVAELIEATIELRQRQRDYLADPRDQRSNEKGRLVGVAAQRVDAALARIGAP